MAEIESVCLTNEDGEWMCRVGCGITKREMVRQVAELWCVTQADVLETTERVHMRPLAPEEKPEADDYVTHLTCNADHPDAEPYWMVSA